MADTLLGGISRWRDALVAVCDNQDPQSLLALLQTIKIKPGALRIALDGDAVSQLLLVKLDRIEDDIFTTTSPFQIRKRGVETKLALGGDATDLDETLIQNLAQAHQWFDQIREVKGNISRVTAYLHKLGALWFKRTRKDLSVDARAHNGDGLLVDACSVPLLDNIKVGLTFLIASTGFPAFLAQEVGR